MSDNSELDESEFNNEESSVERFESVCNIVSEHVLEEHQSISLETLFVAYQFDGITVLIDNGVGKERKIYDMSSSGLTIQQQKALIGLHAFTGNDYVSCFFRKGKKMCWKTMKQRLEFKTTFAALGDEAELSQEVISTLETFTRCLYGYPRLQSVNDVRRKLFWQRYEEDEKIIDLSLMPPCQRSLELHCKRANYVAFMYRNADRLILAIESPERHGWSEDGSITWSQDCFPEDINERIQDAADDTVSQDFDIFEDDYELEDFVDIE